MKKNIIILTLALLLAPIVQATTTQESEALQADALYRSAHYAEAAQGYEGVLAEGFCSAELYYNLGNSYYRLGQMGRAILNYERALRLSPSMGDARENLDLANSKTTDRIAVLPKLFIVRWYDALCTRVTPATWQIIVLILLALTGAAVALLCLSRRLGVRKGAFISLLSLAVLLILAVLLLIVSTSHFNARRAAIVMQPSVTVKSSPEMQSVDKMILHEGTKVTIVDHLSGWYKITLADGTTGWCQTHTVERI